MFKISAGESNSKAVLPISHSRADRVVPGNNNQAVVLQSQEASVPAEQYDYSDQVLFIQCYYLAELPFSAGGYEKPKPRMFENIFKILQCSNSLEPEQCGIFALRAVDRLSRVLNLMSLSE